MGKRGPKPTPTAALIKRGSWRAKDREKAGEVSALTGKFNCPRWLSPEAKKVWKRLKCQLMEMGTLSLTDENVLARYAATWDQWRKCDGVVRKQGLTHRAPLKQGGAVTRMRPEAKMLIKLNAILTQLDSKLGLTPADRVGIKPTKAHKPTPLKPKDEDGFSFTGKPEEKEKEKNA